MSKPKVSSQNVQPPNEADDVDVDESTKPEFIYGGPFIKVEKPSPFINTATPINIQLQGTFKKSFAYYSLKERLPIILTKVIDYLSREGAKIKTANSANDEDIQGYIRYITKLKNDLVTNKTYDLLTVDTPEAKKWNLWIQNADNQHYFTNVWVFTECYVYRRLREGCELSKGLTKFDPFDEQKDKAFKDSLEPMCVVADQLVTMLPPSDKDKRKADLTTLLKVCLWANKCDLSLSMGEQVSLKSGDANATEAAPKLIDPFQIIIDLKDKLIVDDTGKICDQLVAKTEAIKKAIEAEKEKPKEKPAEGEAEEEEELPKIPCPAKMTIPEMVTFDIVCDNAGYELFSDLCIAHFLVSQELVQRVRFHVKKIPWFVSDVTPEDFKKTLDACCAAEFSKEVPQEANPAEVAEGEEPPPPPPPIQINSQNVRQLGQVWQQYYQDGTFVVMSDDFWTSPHVYKDMKKYNYNLYRKLQLAVAILFKGDLNYRKLLGERNCNPMLGFEPALQGFIPAPIIAVRTVKADLICGLGKGRFEQLNKIDAKWMEKGDYGVIQFCAKAEPLKPSDRPCEDYGDECRGVVCPKQ